MHKLGVFMYLLGCAEASAAGILQEINTNAAVDLVNVTSLEDHSLNKLNVRGAELQFFGPLDHNFEANLNLAGHYDEGQFKIDLHEATIGSGTLLPQTQFKVGKFFLGVGRLNGFHQHDWPFVIAPKVHREFFTPGAETTMQSEGAADTGAELTYLLPLTHFLEITVGATNNYCYGHCHTEGTKPPYPLHYFHPKTFFETESGGVLLGASYLVRKNAAKTKTELFGVDITWKSRDNKRLAWLLQTEIFFQQERAHEGEFTRKAGFYMFPQYGLSDHWYLGFRFDGYSHLSMKWASTDTHRRDFDYGLSPTLTWKASEFTTIRLAYSHEVDTTQGDADVRDRQVQLQLAYVLGAHPVHSF